MKNIKKILADRKARKAARNPNRSEQINQFKLYRELGKLDGYNESSQRASRQSADNIGFF